MMTPEHRAAISLNNTGVTLLQRRCYRQGMTTLCNAVAVMNAAFHRMKEVGAVESAPEPSQFCLDTMLREAAQQLAMPAPAMDYRTTNAIDQCEVRVLSDDHSPSLLQQEINQRISTLPSVLTANASTNASHHGGGGKVAYLLRIDVLDSDFSAQQNYDLQSSVILQNFGVSYRCLADLTMDLSIKQEFLVAAMRLFHLSYTILTTTCGKEDQAEEISLRRIILTATLVLQNLVDLSTLLGLYHYGEEYSSRLENMRTSALAMHDCSHAGFTAGAA